MMYFTDKLIKYAVGAIAGAVLIGGYMSADIYNLQKKECETERIPPMCWVKNTPAMLVRMTTGLTSGVIAGTGLTFALGFFPAFIRDGKKYGVTGYASQAILFTTIALSGYVVITSGIIRAGDELAQLISPVDPLSPEERAVMTEKGRISVMETPNVKAFLDMIAYGEGMEKEPEFGYKTKVGYEKFNSYEQHPNDCVRISSINDCSTAAGRYQFLNRTWWSLQARLRLPDFSPTSQDKAAIQLLKDYGIYDLVKQGKIDKAIFKASRVWASMPSSYHNRSFYRGQSAKRVQSLRVKYNQYLEGYKKHEN